LGSRALERELEERFTRARAAFSVRISAFQAFLERTPTLGVGHELGKLILETINGAEFPNCTADGHFFRARLTDGAKVLGPEDLDAPPVGKSSDARFNHAGQRVLYLASTEEVAIAETMGDLDSALVWVKKVNLEPIEHLLDLSVAIEELGKTEMLLLALLESDALNKPGGPPGSNWKPGYLLPRFIADCARRRVTPASAIRPCGPTVTMSFSSAESP
jgi:RES domain